MYINYVCNYNFSYWMQRGLYTYINPTNSLNLIYWYLSVAINSLMDVSDTEFAFLNDNEL